MDFSIRKKISLATLAYFIYEFPVELLILNWWDSFSVFGIPDESPMRNNYELILGIPSPIFGIPDEPPMLCNTVLSFNCNCVLYFFICMSRSFAHYFFIWCTELTQLCLSSGSLFFALQSNRRYHALKTITLILL